MTAQLLPSQQKIASSDIEVAHRDELIPIIEVGPEIEGGRRLSQTSVSSASDYNEGRDQ
jgi:hypothetical protein